MAATTMVASFFTSTWAHSVHCSSAGPLWPVVQWRYTAYGAYTSPYITIESYRTIAQGDTPMIGSVLVERSGPVYTVLLNRPEVRNAVDGPTAAALAEAFRAFDADDAALVAVLTGVGPAFCAGADLKAIGTPRGIMPSTDGDGPMGPTRMRLT